MVYRTWAERLARKNKRAEKSVEVFGFKRARKKTGTERQRLIVLLDGLVGTYAKLRDKIINSGRCRICNVNPIEAAYHIIPRGKWAVRFDTDNVLGSCHNCNYGEKNHRLEYREKHIAILGLEKYTALWEKGKQTAKFSIQDLRDMIENIRRKIEMVCYEVKKTP